ncbi:MAG: alanine dehydrogenase, partial [Mucilaginibacter sp.]|nr:alanine dehydrogenase [Mucilaginibacter sp.]
ATLGYALQIANKGYNKAFATNPALLKGLNTYNGKVTYKAVADVHNYPFVEAAFK